MVSDTLVDSSVLIDVLTDDRRWGHWSSERLAEAADAGAMVINIVVYAEASVGYDTIDELAAALPEVELVDIPTAAAFLAARAHVAYRRRAGQRTTTLPDSFIGAHAAVSALPLLTRDPKRVRRAFPTVEIISP